LEEIMRILLAGATGFLGRHLAAELVARGHTVVGCARRREDAFHRYPELGWMRADFATEHGLYDWLPRLAGFDAVINAAGILRETRGQSFRAVHVDGPNALYRACARHGVSRVIHVSALGIHAGAHSRYLDSKLQAELMLASLDLDWAVVRPSLIYGEDSPGSRAFRLLARLPFMPLIGKGTQRLQPIHVDDLCDAVANLLDAPERRCATLDLAGRAPLTLREFVAALRHGLGLGEPRCIEIPHLLVRAAVALADSIGRGPLSRDTLAMLEAGNTTANNAAPQLLGREPMHACNFISRAPGRGELIRLHREPF
jgi:nucleoside-diphosphate-sugar epimerase